MLAFGSDFAAASTISLLVGVGVPSWFQTNFISTRLSKGLSFLSMISIEAPQRILTFRAYAPEVVTLSRRATSDRDGSSMITYPCQSVVTGAFGQDIHCTGSFLLTGSGKIRLHSPQAKGCFGMFTHPPLSTDVLLDLPSCSSGLFCLSEDRSG